MKWRFLFGPYYFIGSIDSTTLYWMAENKYGEYGCEMIVSFLTFPQPLLHASAHAIIQEQRVVHLVGKPTSHQVSID